MYQLYIDLLFSLQIIIWKFKNFHLSLIFPSYSFWIQTTNTFLHFHTRFLTNLGKIYTGQLFLDRYDAKTVPFGAANTIWIIPLPPTPHPPRGKSGGGGGGVAGGWAALPKVRISFIFKRHECRFWNIPNAPISLFRVVLNVPGKSALVWISLLINYFQGQSVVLRNRQTLIDLVNDACVSSCQQNCYFSRTQWTFLDKLWNSLLDY